MAKCMIGPSGGGKVTVSGLAANKILQGTTVTVKQGSKTVASVAGSIPSKAAATYTPKTTNQTIAAGQYLAGAQTIKGDANLVSENILTGKAIFGVAGRLDVLGVFATAGSGGRDSWYINQSGAITLAPTTGALNVTLGGKIMLAYASYRGAQVGWTSQITVGGVSKTLTSKGPSTIVREVFTGAVNSTVQMSHGADAGHYETLVVLGTKN